MPLFTMMYWPPRKPMASPAGSSSSSTRACGATSSASTTVAVRAEAMSVRRVELVHEVVQLFHVVVEVRERLDLVREIQVDLARQHRQRAQVAELRVARGRAGQLLLERRERRLEEALRAGQV